MCGTLGGINYIEVDPYPDTVVQALPDLGGTRVGLSLVFLGRAHNSSDLHHQVIEGLGGRTAEVFSRLRDASHRRTRRHARPGSRCIGAVDVRQHRGTAVAAPGARGSGRGPGDRVAAARGALGWKVNGAGGDGGSVTILSATGEDGDVVGPAVQRLDRRFQVLPVVLSPSGCEVSGSI